MRSVIVLVSILAAGPAATLGEPVVDPVQAPGHNPLDCYCRAYGRIFALGETVCLRVGEEGRIAECRMVTNVTSWGVTEKPCPVT